MAENFAPPELVMERNVFYVKLFIPKGKRLTFGELEPQKKYRIDHRFNAFKKIKKFF